MLGPVTRGRWTLLFLGASCLLVLLAVLRFAALPLLPSQNPGDLPKARPPAPAPAAGERPAAAPRAGGDDLGLLLKELRNANRPITVAEARKLRDTLLAFPSFLSDLLAVLQDASAPLSLRQGIGVVLGTLPAGKTALLEALRTGSVTGLERTVILAIGIRAIEDGDLFDRKGEPFSMEPASGLFVFVSGPLPDQESRSALARFLAGSPADEVRRAAARVLRDSIGFPDVRTALVGRLETEHDPETLGESAAALATWTRSVRLEDNERGQIVGKLLDLAPQADEVVRFRLTSPISSTPLASAEWERLRGLAEAPAANSRLFVTEVLGKRIGVSADEDTRALPILTRAAVGDGDAAVREAAALALGRVATVPAALQSLTTCLQADADWEVRAAAARSLGQARNSEAARDALQKAAQSDAHPTVRQVAQRSLQR
jgi:HEAT repeat protein